MRYFLTTIKGITGQLLMILILCAGLSIILPGCRKVPEEELSEILVFKTVDPLIKVFRETAFFREIDSPALSARGEHATLQFVVRSQKNISALKLSLESLVNGKDTLDDIRIGYVDYVYVGRNTPDPSRDKLYSSSGFYPDPIITRESMVLAASQTQPIWVTIAVPAGTPEGTYNGMAELTGNIEGKRFTTEKEVKLKVYPVTIDETSLWVTNWYSTSDYNLELIFGEKDIPRFSEKYWAFIRLLASKMAEYRQNVALISPLRLSEYTLDREGNYEIDFSHFDRTVEIFREEGVLGRIEGGHIGTRKGGWISDFVVFAPVIEEDTTYLKKFDISNDTARTFYRSFIPALVQHLKEKGWDRIYMQHLMDEPIPENIDTYIEIARFIKKLAPDMKIVEACHSKDLDNTVDVWVPQLDYMHQDYEFYEERTEKGDEIWFYTCLNPKGEYANRFIELPLIKTRILHWINYRYQIPGYLHWGFNFWRKDPFFESTSIQLESGTILPGGDAWIVYPGDSTLYSSIRLEAMRDGIVDYELLKMLGNKYPDEAAEIARQVVYRFDYYDTNVEDFRAKRRLILEKLSE